MYISTQRYVNIFVGACTTFSPGWGVGRLVGAGVGCSVARYSGGDRSLYTGVETSMTLPEIASKHALRGCKFLHTSAHKYKRQKTLFKETQRELTLLKRIQ